MPLRCPRNSFIGGQVPHKECLRHHIGATNAFQMPIYFGFLPNCFKKDNIGSNLQINAGKFINHIGK